MPKTDTFEQKYPNLSRFVEEIGWIEIGQNEMINSFVRAYDLGGTVYHGKSNYPNLEAAFQDLEAAIKQYLEDLGI
jgi:exodeoxyribonuclease V alpha subunit